MNLIQISEQLKEAPDNLLLQEVKAPTGSYPSYLIISELSRRKRLRDGAQPQQAPQTTVADDLSQPAGLAATPQAMQSTAGMDVNGQGDYEEQQEMPQMAGGGLVAFRQGKDVNSPFALSVENDLGTGFYGANSGYNQRISQYEQDLARARAEEERLGRQLTPEEQNAARESEYGRFGKMVPFRREEQADRIAQRERGLEGERESNANMALMEAGLGMMGSRATRGMQGIAEGGLRGLSSFKAGKQDIKKSEAYLDQAKDNFNRAQELYDAGKYAAGEKALEKAESQRQQVLANARARTEGLYRGRSEERQEQMFPGQLESQQLGLSAARQVTPLAGDKALADIDLTKARAADARANAAYLSAGGKGGGGGFASGTELKSAQDATKELLMSPQPIPGLKGEQPLLPGTKQYIAAYQRLLPMIVYQNKGKQMFMPIPGQPAPQTGAPGVIQFDASGQRVQ